MQLLLRALLAVSSIAILGSALYYAAPVTNLGLLVVALIALGVAWRAPLTTMHLKASNRPTAVTWLTALLVIVALAAWWSAILPIAITDAVRSPWGPVDPRALIALGIATFGCLLLAAQEARTPSLILTTATLFSALAMAAVVYPLGFGFDPFLHRATIAHIAEHGTITPKPLYYIGEYALTLTGVKLLHLPLFAFDRFLLPVFAAVALPLSMTLGLAPLLQRRALLALSALFLVPFSIFVSTTPQGIAYVFAACAILLSFARRNGKHVPLWALALFALAAVLTHPFAGIPAALFIACQYALERLPTRYHPVGLAVGGLIAAGVIPLLFVMQAMRAGLALRFAPQQLLSWEAWHSLALTAFASNRFSTIYDGLYLVIDNLQWILIAVAVVGLVVLHLHYRRHCSVALYAPLVFAVGMVVNFLVLSLAFDFAYLISYERTDYALRALTMASLFLLPYAGIALAYILDTLAKRPVVLRASVITLLSLIAMSNVYGAYPRHDNYATSAGFNVSSADITAVQAIDARADGESYIVLANQITSAAAVATYGFRTYYHGTVFYYPIPTGEALYQHYLTMASETPSRDTMLEAMDLAGVNLAFFAMSDYWWQAENIVENTKRLTDEWFTVEDGAITVFVFRR